METHRRTGAGSREQLLQALELFCKEDFSARLPSTLEGVDAQVVQAFNAAAEANERFAAQARRVDERTRNLERERAELERERAAVEEMAARMAAGARRQVEFLAHMAEDLRMPLDAVLKLAKLLADDDHNNLTAQQVDFAQAIYAAGTDLLSLIDEILDLARTESEPPAASAEVQRFRDLRETLLRTFREPARERRLNFDVVLSPSLPEGIRADGKRLRQTLKNLLSMAFKSARGNRVMLLVSGTGQGVEFEVVQDGEGGAGRDHGAALRLSICRELARSLGGELEAVRDTTGERLVLRLPNPSDAGNAERRTCVSVAAGAAVAAGRRRDGEAVVLVAEGNAQVASVLLDIVRANGYEGAVATDLRSLRLLMREMAPEAVIFGASLTDVDAWTALAELRRLPAKTTPASLVYRDAHCYVCLEVGPPVGGGEDAVDRIVAGLDAAAGRRVKRILAVGASAQATAEESWLAHGRQLSTAADGQAALDALAEGGFEGVVLGPALGGMDPWTILRGVDPPVLDRSDLAFALIEADASGPASFGVIRHRTRLEYVLAETALHLQRSIERRPAPGRELTGRRRTAPELAGRKALVVDDDIYNIYAMTGALEQQGMNVVLAENGREAVKLLGTDASIDAVLMDVTMPDVDGQSLLRALRGAARPALPIIAVTPRAMQGDREKCIGAGASDYISKPVNLEQLLSLLRAWLGHRPGARP